MKFAKLDTRSLVNVTGEDAEKFLQALITCDVDHLSPGEGNFGALLTPQGKILFDFFIIRTEAGFLVDVASALRDEFVKRLSFYKLRAKVVVAPADDLSVFAVWDGIPADGMAIADPRLPEMGYRLYGPQKPEGGTDYAYGDAFPHEALMDQFGGVDFAKGCYVGQEVVSRMQHRGTARKRVIVVEGDLPAPGTEIEAGGKTAGTMGSSNGAAGLAMLRLDRVLDAGHALQAGGKTLTAKLQPWVKFGWPEA